MEKSHHQLKTNKGFTLIELLVVITLLGIFAVVAYPNVIKWINDREVKAEAMRTAGFINEMRSTVGSGKYGMLQAVLQSDVNVYTMSNENFRNIYKNLTQNNTYKRNNSCAYRQSGTSRKTNLETIKFPTSGNDYVVHISPNRTVLCMTTDGLLNYGGNQTETDPETRKIVNVLTICSRGNTTQSSCTYRARQDSMYKVTIDKNITTKIYRLKNKSTWVKIDG